MVRKDRGAALRGSHKSPFFYRSTKVAKEIAAPSPLIFQPPGDAMR
ncbi:hypothetical protein BH10PSE7_BH10PSE7_16590 [soil metagenome]